MSLYALYLVALNVFLSTSLFERVINQEPETISVTYERGWTVWPGTVHAQNLRIRSSDSHVQFLLRIERCEFDLSFLDLARKKFHPTRVVGSGVTFDARQRIDGPTATPEYVDALPPIPGFERIPLRPQGPQDERTRWDDGFYHLWTVHLEDVTANDVRRIWIDTARFDGEARVTGGFYLKPIRAAHVGPIHVDVISGRTAVKQRVVAEPMVGAIDVLIRQFDPRTSSGKDLLHRITVATDLHGRSPDLANLPRSLTGPARFAGPADLRRVAVRIEDGNLAKDSHVDIAALGVSVEVAHHRFTGALAVRADIPNDAGPAKLLFKIDAQSVTAKHVIEGDEEFLGVARAVDITGDATSLDLWEPLRDLHVVAVMPQADMPDARVLTRYVPPGASFGFERGHARARARVEAWFADRTFKAEGHLEADDLDLRVAKARLRGNTKLDASVDAWRWAAKQLDGAKAIIHVASGSIASQDSPRQRIADVRGLDIVVGAPEVDLDNPMKTFHAKVDLPDAEIIDRTLLRSYLPKGQEMQITKGHARFSARCELDVKNDLGSGTLDLNAARLGFTLAKLDLLADVRAHARVHQWAWEHGDLAVDEAKVDITNVTVTMQGGVTGQAPALAVRLLALEARSNRFAFSDPLAHVELKGTLAGGALTDPVALDAFLPPGSEILFDSDKRGAPFDAQLVATIDRRVARGTVRASGRGIGFRSEKVRVRGDLEASADVEAWRLDEDKMRVKSSRVIIQSAAVDLGEAKSEGGVDGDGPPALRARRIELQARTDELDLAQPSLDHIDYRLVLDHAQMDDATRFGVLLSKADAVAFAVESGRAHGDADITVNRSEGKATGGVKLVLEDAGMRLHDTHLSGTFEIVANVKGFDGNAVDIEGSRITMRDVKARGTAADTSAWSGELRLLQGAVRISETPAFDAFAQLRADNAKPFLAMVLGNNVPKFVVGLLTAEGLSGQARIAVELERVAILDAHVRGDDVVAYGDYVVVGEHVRGAVVVAKGPFSVGLKVDDSGTSLRLWALESWLGQEKRAVLALFAEGEARAKAQADAKAKVQADARARSQADAKRKPVAH